MNLEFEDRELVDSSELAISALNYPFILSDVDINELLHMRALKLSAHRL